MFFEKGSTCTYGEIVNIEFSEEFLSSEDCWADVWLNEYGNNLAGEHFLCLHIEEKVFSFLLTGNNLYECVYTGQAL